MNRLPAIALVALLVAGAIWGPHDADGIDLLARHAAPSWTHVLGTDQVGRDLLARIVTGAWRTLAVVAIVTLIAVGAGLAFGLVASLSGAWLENALLRLAELSIVMPTLVVGLTASAIFGLNPVSAGLSLGLAGIGPYALLTHALARRSLARPFVLAARALGASRRRILLRHVLPDMLPVLAAHIGSNAGLTIIAYASLAFLGLGTDSSQADWGAMVFEYRGFMFDHPELMLWPGAAIAATVFAINQWLDPGDA